MEDEYDIWLKKALDRGWKVPVELNLPKHSWVDYWKKCELYEQFESSENNENARLRKKLEQEKKRRKWAEETAQRAREREDEAERRRAAQKAAMTRLRNRAKACLCPCCRRHFKQLSAHIAKKHPDYEAEQHDC